MHAIVRPALLTLAVIAATGCKDKPKQAPAPAAPAARYQPDPDAAEGLTLKLTEGEALFEKTARPTTVPATPLSEAETKAVLSRLPKVEGAEKKSFAFPPETLPAPRTGETVEASFPPPAAPDAPPPEQESKGLEVMRFAPRGKVPIAPQMSVTFSQPMVPVTSHATLAKKEVPVQITPEIKGGSWRWVGAKTLFYEADERLPMATKYEVTVPAGTKSANGDVLARAKSWSFTTPSPVVQMRHPVYGPHDTDPVMYLAFDQSINQKAVLASIVVKTRDSDGAESVPLRLATAEEIQNDETVSAWVKDAEPDRWVAFKAATPFEPATRVSVDVGPGTPSAEGPRVTEEPQTHTFHTYYRLAVERHRCGWYWDTCRPHHPFVFEFNNPLDAEKFDPKTVTVEPALDGAKITVSGGVLSVEGRTKPRTKYTVTLPESLPDSFGQTLGKAFTHTFQVGPAHPQLSAARQGFVVLDPAAKGTYSVFSVNFKKLRVKIHRVEPKHFEKYMSTVRDTWYRGRPPSADRIPGRLVFDRVIEPKGPPDEQIETPIDLSPALTDGYGHAVVTVTHLDPPPPHESRTTLQAWVQVTDIGLDAFVDATELIAWATNLTDGTPLQGVDLSLMRSDGTATSDASGLGVLPLGKSAKGPREVLLARKGADLAFLPDSITEWSSGRSWVASAPKDSLLWYVFDDRGMYRPEETARIKGWIRRMGGGKRGTLAPLGDGAKRITWKLFDARGNEISKGKEALNSYSGFDFEVALSEKMNLGPARLELTAKDGSLEGQTRSHTFQVQHFRRPEFEVSVDGTDAPYLIADSADFTVTGAYYAGGGLVGAPVAWSAAPKQASFHPPGHEQFSFGAWSPWWSSWTNKSYAVQTESLEGTTDAQGKHRLHAEFLHAKPALPFSVALQATITDVNRQAWSTTKNLLVHPADRTVGLRSRRPFVDRGKPMEVEAIVTDLDGELKAGVAVTMEAALVRWKWDDGEFKEEMDEPQTCSMVSAQEAKECSFETPDGGSYRITARIQDARGRPSETTIRVWVTGAKLPPSRDVEVQNLTLVPEKREYQPGEKASILVVGPFAPAQGLLSLRRGGVLEKIPFAMAETTHTLTVPITEAHISNLHVQVDLVGAAERTKEGEPAPQLPKRPALARGTVELSVPPLARELAVTVTPKREALPPGGKTEVQLLVRDADGRAVADTEIAVVVVDESVLALSGYQLVDPLTIFYAKRGAGVRDYHTRESVLLANAESLLELAEAGSKVNGLTGLAPGVGSARGIGGLGLRGTGNGGGGLARRAPAPARSAPAEAKKMSRKRETSTKRAESRADFAADAEYDADEAPPEPGAPIAMRADFSALALFEPEVRTDRDGRATVKLAVPDNLTRYRIMAVAVDESGLRYGKGEASLTARLPLMVRPSPPRFLSWGDRMELPVVLQNQTDEPMTVSVAVRADNARLTEGAGRKVTVPANDRVEVRFPSTTVTPGKAAFQLAAVSEDISDAATVTFPVWTPATAEAFATYGEVDEGAIFQPVEAPADVVTEFGGLEVTTSSTQLQALTDAVMYLASYPFECAEQVSSRMLGIAALRDVLEAFDAEGLPPMDELLARVNKDIRRLTGLQNGDGGFGLWRNNGESWPYASTHATLALAVAKEKGFQVPEHVLANAKWYLRGIEGHTAGWICRICRRHVIAYATYVLDRLGEKHPEKARRILAEKGLDGVTKESLGWVLPVLKNDPWRPKIVKYLSNRVNETAATASFAIGWHDGDYLVFRSSRVADAVILDGWMQVQPRSDLIPKLVRGLLGHRVRGRWNNTQENVFVLLALDRYFGKYEKTKPDFVARAWLGDRFAGSHAFKGRTTERHLITIPMGMLAEGDGKHRLALGKEGPGRMYYRVGMRYAPTDLELEPADHGFTVTRRYEAIDDEGDVTRDAKGAWHVRAGSRVRVRLEMVAPSRRYHVALIDPLPAGLEPLNPALKTTGSIPQDTQEGDESGGGFWWWWRGPWFEHQNFRDERVEAFASLLWDGVHKYSYVAQATTPGEFIAAPARAEEMYHPETFGRSGTDRVFVEAGSRLTD